MDLLSSIWIVNVWYSDHGLKTKHLQVRLVPCFCPQFEWFNVALIIILFYLGLGISQKKSHWGEKKQKGEEGLFDKILHSLEHKNVFNFFWKFHLYFKLTCISGKNINFLFNSLGIRHRSWYKNSSYHCR